MSPKGCLEFTITGCNILKCVVLCRGLTSLPRLPVLRSGSVDQYKLCGFNGVLAKPFKVADVRQVVEFSKSLYPLDSVNRNGMPHVSPQTRLFSNL